MNNKIVPTLPTIALFGRTNVGKSTLFNRLTEHREALVSPIPGTTRDYKEGILIWRGRHIRAIDTGGVETLRRRDHPAETLPEKIQAKIAQALGTSDVILFLLDATTGVVPLDRALLHFANIFKKPVLIVANKTDNNRIRSDVATMPPLGGDRPIPVSAANGSGVGDLLDVVVQTLSERELPIIPPQRDPALAVANDQLPDGRDADVVVTILGKPNVGKSTLLNAILGEERAIVHHEPHTTREPIDTWFQYKGQTLKVTDTAGIRRHVALGLEKKGVDRTLERLERTDIALLLFDPFSETLTHQDRALAGVVKESGVSTILVANKYDLRPVIASPEGEPSAPCGVNSAKQSRAIQADQGIATAPSGPRNDDTTAHSTLANFERLLRQEFPFFDFAPLVAIAAKTDWRVRKLLDLVLTVAGERRRQLPRELMDAIFQNIRHELGTTRVRTRKTRRETPKLTRLTQTATNPPAFTVQTRRNAKIPFPIIKIVEKHIRALAPFSGTPMKIHVVRK